jgi:hypothetical protein
MNGEAPRDDEKENAFDLRMAEALRSLSPPAGGMDELLKLIGEAKQPAVVQASFSRRHWMKAAAAAIVTVAGGGVIVQRRLRSFGVSSDPATAEGFLTAAVEKATGMINLRFKDSNWNALNNAQKALGVPVSTLATAHLASLSAKGCQDYEWKGHRVGLTCFLNQDNALIHIFSVSTAAFNSAPGAPAALSAVDRRMERDHFSWGEADSYHVLVAAKPDTKVTQVRERFLS